MSPPRPGALVFALGVVGGALGLSVMSRLSSAPPAAVWILASSIVVGAAFAAALVAEQAIERRSATLRRQISSLFEQRERHESLVLPVFDAPGLDAATHVDRLVENVVRERDHLQVALESLEEGVLTLDASRRITLANRAGTDILGLSERPVGLGLADVAPDPALVALVDDALGGEPGSSERSLSIPGSTVTRLYSLAKPLRGGGALLVLRDESRLFALQRAQREFVANVSHELRTPVSIIRTSAEALGDGGIADPVRGPRFLAAIVRHADRLSHLIDDLLDLSRLDSGRYLLEVGEVGVAALVAQVADELEPRAEERKIAIDRAGLDPEARAWADVGALEQIVVNLLDNAIKYSPAGAKVTLTTRTLPTRVRVEVEDQGPGIPEEHRARLFERFYRIDKGRSRDQGGTGLGLSITRDLTLAMGGQVGIRPSGGKGSTFWVELVRSNQPKPAPRGRAA